MWRRTGLLTTLLVAVVALQSVPARALEFTRVEAVSTPAATAERLELAADLDRSFDNPYDPAEIRVDGRVTLPDGSERILPAFWFVPCELTLEGEREVIRCAETGEWRLRFTPAVAGVYAAALEAQDDSGQRASSEPVTFEIPAEAEPGSAPGSRGFIRVDERNPRYLRFDSGASYVPIGFNVAWIVEPGGSFVMADYLGRMAAHGGNWARLWMSHFGNGYTVEWSADHPSGDYHGLGRYSPEAAARLDAIFASATEQGIYLQLVLNHHSQFEVPMWSSWEQNPLNAANGGPLASSEGFFTDPEADRLYENRLRYVVARYSHATALLAFELFNEVEVIAGYTPSVVRAWQREKAARIRELDPHEHLVTTSYGLPLDLLGDYHDFDSDTFDLSQAHLYVRDFHVVIQELAPLVESFGKPAIVGEFGLDWMGELMVDDPQGLHLHEALLTASLSGWAGGAMSWYWDEFILPNDLFHALAGPAALFGGNAEHDLPALDMSPFTQRVEAVELEGGRASELEVLGMEEPRGRALLWVLDERYHWLDGDLEQVTEHSDVVLTLPDRRARSRWIATYIDAWTGEPIRAQELQATGSGAVRLDLPPFTGDLLVRLLARSDTHGPDPTSSSGCQCNGAGPANPGTVPGLLLVLLLVLAVPCSSVLRRG